MLYYIDGTVACDDVSGNQYTDAQCTTAFVAYMAKKCTQLGMTGTYYANPSGLTADSYITPRDMLKLGIATAANPKSLEIWATPSQNFAVRGDNARTISITNNVITGVGETIDNAGYKFLGGKGGSYWSGSNYWRAGVDVVDIDGHPVILSLLAKGQTSYNNLHLSTKELCDMVKASLEGQTPTEGTNLSALVTNGGGYCACLVPDDVGAYVNLESPAELLNRDYSIYASSTISSLPASTSKAMTVLCALDFVKDMHISVKVKTVDISSGSGSTFYDGDILDFWDAIRIMMAESSNTLANTIARTVGGLILAYAA